MKSLFSTLCLCLFFVTLSFAQTENAFDQKDALRIGLLAPNIEYETAIGTASTLHTEIGVGLGFGYGGEITGWVFDYQLFLSAGPRYYYNVDKRIGDEKSVKNFSANYVGLSADAYLNDVLSSIQEPNYYAIGPVWGMQRDWGKGWYFNLEAGPGLGLQNSEVEFTVLLGLDIGFHL